MERLGAILLYVLIGAVSMLLPMGIVAKSYRLRIYKLPLIVFLSSVIGLLSASFWHFIENGRFDGISFFGCVFIMPLAAIAESFVVREKMSDLLDEFSVCICVMLAAMKINCCMSGCCGGRDISLFGINYNFPSQQAEFINAVILMAILLTLAISRKHRGKLYPLFMVLYGVTRFFLNFFRQEYDLYKGGFPPWGTVWSIVSIIIGIVWLSTIKKNSSKVQELT
ncbi:MAG: prolipoprotein diacylglyceryl transferase [Clostridia bacterium]|nr:prolipoprotein diacylglyceryl transferase [Clostridia bacterium]